MPLLEIQGLSKQFGGVVALNNLDMFVEEAEILGVIGPNGSGKTTLFNVVAGVHRPTAGHVVWQGRNITARPSHEIARMGIGRTFQQAMTFSTLTVFENVQIACENNGKRHEANPPDANGLLDFVGLSGARLEPANTLPFGSLRKLGLAIALGTRPSLLLLDEPGAGLNDSETSDLAKLIAKLPDRGVTVCIIDHDMDLIAELCHRLVVLDFGQKISEGSPDAVRSDPKVLEIYLGTDL